MSTESNTSAESGSIQPLVICGACRHWRKIREQSYRKEDGQEWPGPHGECCLIDEYSTDKKAWTDLALGPLEPTEPMVNAGGEACLITMPDFGCVHGEIATDNGLISCGTNKKE